MQRLCECIHEALQDWGIEEEVAAAVRRHPSQGVEQLSFPADATIEVPRRSVA